MKTVKKILKRFLLSIALVLVTVNATSSYATGEISPFYTWLSPFYFREKSSDTVVFAGQFAKMTFFRIAYKAEKKEK